MQEINTKTYLKKKKIKRENMEEIDMTNMTKYVRHDMSEEKKQKLKEYQRDYHEANKGRNLAKNALLYPQQTSSLLILFLIFLCTALAQ